MKQAKCPCGSGQLAAECCAKKIGSPEFVREVLDGLRGMLQDISDKEVLSAEQLEYTITRSFEQYNDAPLKDCEGLSPNQMHDLLYRTFEAPHLVTFPQPSAKALESPVMRLFFLLVEAIGGDGLKATEKGNLPRKFCQESALAYWGPELHAEMTHIGKIWREDDFGSLAILRTIAQDSGLLRMYKGKFILSSLCKKLLKDEPEQIYSVLFRHFTTRYSWGWYSRDDELHIILQLSFAYTLLLLTNHGADWRPINFYGEKFLKAFPFYKSNINFVSPQDPDYFEKLDYEIYCIRGFAHFFGLAELDRSAVYERFEKQGRVRATEILAEVAVFNPKLLVKSKPGR